MIVDKAITCKLIYIGSALPAKIPPSAEFLLGLKYGDVNNSKAKWIKAMSSLSLNKLVAFT